MKENDIHEFYKALEYGQSLRRKEALKSLKGAFFYSLRPDILLMLATLIAFFTGYMLVAGICSIFLAARLYDILTRGPGERPFIVVAGEIWFHIIALAALGWGFYLVFLSIRWWSILMVVGVFLIVGFLGLLGGVKRYKRYRF